MPTTTNLAVLALTAVLLVPASSLIAESPKPFGDIAREGSEDWEYAAEFSDEFEGPNVNRNKWNIDTEDWGPWSWEPENAFQNDGSMHLRMVQGTHQRGKNTLHYKSGIARSIKTIAYGYFEARVRGCARYPGACPAFWLYSKGPQNRYHAKDGETVAYSEIDIVELQQCEWDSKTKKHFEVNHIDCNLHTVLLKNGRRQWVRPHGSPEMCKNEFDAPWDPREDYHVYAVENTKDSIVWYVDGKEVARKPNLYWHLPMHVTLSLGLRYPFVAYENGEMAPVPEETTTDGFPTTMSVDYVRVWRNMREAAATRHPSKQAPTDQTRDEYVAMEKAKWAKMGWTWNQNKVESNFAEMDINQDGLASGSEREVWYAKKKASMKN